MRLTSINTTLKKNNAPTTSSMSVYKTYDYALFSHIEGNRNIEPRNVERLKASMQEKYLPVPIVCNELMQIIDGQNREEAARSLGLPIYYMVVPGLRKEDVIRLNVNRSNWSSETYLKAYIEDGLEDYILLQDFKKKYKFPLGECICMLSGGTAQKSGDQTRIFQAGKFRIKNYKKAIEAAEKITEVKPFYEGYNRRSFVYAMLQLFTNPNYSHKEFLSKLSLQQTKMVGCATKQQYIALIEEIYNYRRRIGVNLRF
jgi:hypothetical protein